MNKSELLLLLKNLSAVEGFLWSIKHENCSHVFESYVDPIIELVTEKLNTTSDNTMYVFETPHTIPGATSKVSISRQKVIEHFDTVHKDSNLSNEEKVEEFCVTYGAWKTSND